MVYVRNMKEVRVAGVGEGEGGGRRGGQRSILGPDYVGLCSSL